MLRLLGARGGSGGSRAAGARVITRVIGRRFGLAPADPRRDPARRSRTGRPRASSCGLLSGMRGRPRGPRVRALALAGRPRRHARAARRHVRGGPLPAQGRHPRRPRPGELDAQPRRATARSVGGRTFAFAVMMNGMPLEFVPPDRLVSPAYALEDAIVEALAAYTG